MASISPMKREHLSDDEEMEGSLADYGGVDIAGYDCNNGEDERQPSLTKATPAYVELTAITSDLIQQLDDAIAATQDDVCVKRLQTSAGIKCSDERLSTMRIAVLGDMASGKSSLINSLLGTGTIARKGDSGESCTWVTQHYRQKFPEQTQNFAAKIFFHDTETIQAAMLDLLQRYDSATAEDEFEGDRQHYKIDPDKMLDVEEVIQILLSLFGSNGSFEDAIHVETFLQSTSRDSRLTELSSMARHIIQHQLAGAEWLYFEADDAKTLLDQIQPYTHRLAGATVSGTADMWPLVNRVEFGVDAAIVRHGAVLVDAPGASDASAFRRRIAQDALRTADHVVIVARIGRVLSDLDLRRHVKSASQLHGAAKIILVLTHADSMDDATDCPGSQEQIKQLHDLETRIEAATSTLSDLKRQYRNAKQRTKRQQNRYQAFTALDAIGQELDAGKTQLRQLKAERASLRIHMRNVHVQQALLDVLKLDNKDIGAVHIFSVGNKAYEQYQTGYDYGREPEITIAATGIPSLRNHLRSLPVSAMLGLCKSAIELAIPRRLEHFEYSLSDRTTSSTARVTAESTSDEQAQLEAKSIIEKLKAHLHTALIRPMEIHELVWQQKATNCVETWHQSCPTSLHLDMLRRSGYRKWRHRRVDGSRLIDWNNDLCTLSERELTVWFKRLSEGLSPLLHQSMVTAKRKYSEIVAAVRANFRIDPKDFDRCKKHIASQGALLGAALTRIADEKLKEKFRLIFVRAVQPTHDSYIVKMSAPIFAEASLLLRGRNVQRRLDLLHEKIPPFWSRMKNSTREECEAAIDAVLDPLSAQIGAMYEEIRSTGTQLQGSSASAIAKSKDPVIIRARGSIEQIRSILDGRVKELLVEVEKLHEEDMRHDDAGARPQADHADDGVDSDVEITEGLSEI